MPTTAELKAEISSLKDQLEIAAQQLVDSDKRISTLEAEASSLPDAERDLIVNFLVGGSVSFLRPLGQAMVDRQFMGATSGEISDKIETMMEIATRLSRNEHRAAKTGVTGQPA